MRRWCLGLMLSFAAIGLLMVGSSEKTVAQGNILEVFLSVGLNEQAAIDDALSAFDGPRVITNSTRDLAAVLTTAIEGGNPPDVAILPQPGLMVSLANDGSIVDIESMRSTLEADYASSWIDLGSVDGTLYGCFYGVSNKSLIWYNPKRFAENGYSVPSTWAELEALAAQIQADGGTPWSLAVESGGASGWPGTDWIEDIMLRTAGPDLYDQWVAGNLAFDSPEVRRAWEIFGSVATDDAALFGGTVGAATTFFGDVGIPLFTDPPGAFLAKQASFITSFFQDTNPTDAALVAGEDISFFPFPEIDAAGGTPVLGGGNVIVSFNNEPDTLALMAFLCGSDFQQATAASLGFLSANRGVDSSVLPSDLLRLNNEAIQAAEVVRFDASDLMPPEVGQGTFWTGVVDYITGENLNNILPAIDQSFP